MNTNDLDAPTGVPLRQDASIIALVGLAHASSHFAHLLLPLMFPVFMREFGLSYSELGLLMTTFFVVSGIGQAGAGFFGQRRRTVVPLLEKFFRDGNPSGRALQRT